MKFLMVLEYKNYKNFVIIISLVISLVLEKQKFLIKIACGEFQIC